MKSLIKGYGREKMFGFNVIETEIYCRLSKTEKRSVKG
jgi:hypothetical protein